MMKKRKTKWKPTPSDRKLEGSPLNVNVSVGLRYKAELDKLISKMSRITLEAIIKLYGGKPAKQYFAQDEKSIVVEAKKMSDDLQRKFDELFGDASSRIAEQMVSDADKASAASVQISMGQLSGGLALPMTAIRGRDKEILKASIAENVSLIKTIPQQYLKDVSGAVFRSITAGSGLNDLLPFLQKYKQITLRRAKMIALDQNRKAFNNLSQSRMQSAGITKYEWLHTGGSDKPRKDHIAMNGNIYRFDDPPIVDRKTGERGHPGSLINCRCRLKPVIEFD
jgi:SPP1 gp7 family putative phage head morphogenesis protein